MKRVLGLLVCASFTIILLIGTVFAGQKVYFYHTDAAGTPVAITDANGNVVWRADYKPFGEVQSITGTIENNNQFIGKEKDKETGLHNVGVRQLKDEIGRFISPDPVGPVDPRTSKTNENILLNPQLLNKYSYSVNNPYRYLDPNGKWPEQVHNAIITSAFSGGKYRLSESARTALMRGSANADSREYQDTGHSYMHAMTAPGQSSQDAEKIMNNFIKQKVGEYKTLMSQGNSDKAYEALGMAMHPLMDATSPSHEGMQTWNSPLTHPIEALEHRRGETSDVFNSNPDYLGKSTDVLRKFYENNK
jgi:RHS repeat-associated protein